MNGRFTTGAVTLVALGLVAALVAPGWPQAAEPWTHGRAAALTTPIEVVVDDAVHVAAVPAAPGVQSVGVSIPQVVLAGRIAVRDGRLRTPVLLTDPSVAAAARVRGASGACTVQLRAGAVSWLDCAVPSGRLTVEVVDAAGTVLVSSPVGR